MDTMGVDLQLLFKRNYDKREMPSVSVGLMYYLLLVAFDDGRITFTQDELARDFGASKATFSKLLKPLKACGIIERYAGTRLRVSSHFISEIQTEKVSLEETGKSFLRGNRKFPERKLEVSPEETEVSQQETPSRVLEYKEYKEYTSPQTPNGGQGTDGTEPPKEESLEAILAETRRRWMEEHRAKDKSANASTCHGNGPSSRSTGVGATTLPADTEIPASVAPNGQTAHDLYQHPDNWIEPEPEPSLFPEDEVAPAPKPAPEPKAKPRPKYTERFEEWWKAYPPVRRTGKPQCFAKWKSAIASGVTEEELFLGLARWINSRDWQKDDGQYACAPQVWLNQERWNDTPLPAQTRVRELGGFQVPNAQCVSPQPMAQVPAQEEYSPEEKAFLKIWCKHPSDVALFHRLFAETTAEITCEELNECAASFVKQLRDTEGSIVKLRRPEAYLQDRLWTDDIDYAKALIFHRLPEAEQMRILRERRNGRKAI